MKKKLLVLLGLLLIFSLLAYFYLNSQKVVSPRHHLLCETVQPGMSKDQVLRILEQSGEITVNEGNWSEKSGGVLFIIFTDQKGREVYGSFTLAFWDNKYVAAYRRIGSDDSESICDFSLPTQ